MQLTVPHVDAHGRRRAPLEQTVGEATRRGTEVDDAFALGIETHRPQCAFELDAPAGDVGVVLTANLDVAVAVEAFAALFHPAGTGEDLAGENQGLRAGPRWGEPPLCE